MVSGCFVRLSRSLACNHWVYVLECLGKEGEKIWKVHHTSREYSNDLTSIFLYAYEDVDNKLIRDVVKPFSEIADSALWMLLENLKLWILLVKFVRDCPADDVCEHRLKSLLIAVIVLQRLYVAGLAGTLLIPLCNSFLSHHSDRFVGGFDGYRFDISNRHTINHGRLLLLCFLSFDRRFFCFDLLGCEIASTTCVREVIVDTLSLSHGLVCSHDSLCCHLLGSFIMDAL